jgi:hypothetical protein
VSFVFVEGKCCRAEDPGVISENRMDHRHVSATGQRLALHDLCRSVDQELCGLGDAATHHDHLGIQDVDEADKRPAENTAAFEQYLARDGVTSARSQEYALGDNRFQVAASRSENLSTAE